MRSNSIHSAHKKTALLESFKNDKFYNLIHTGNVVAFFVTHREVSSELSEVFNPNTMSLLYGLLKPHPRMTLTEVETHPWVTDENVATLEECQDFLR